MTASAILNLSVLVAPSHSPVSKGRVEPKVFKKITSICGFVFNKQAPQHILKCISPYIPELQWSRGKAAQPRSTLFVQSERGNCLTGAKQVP